MENYSIVGSLCVGIFGDDAAKAYSYRTKQIHGPVPTSHGPIMIYTDTKYMSSDLTSPYTHINCAIIIIFDVTNHASYNRIGDYVAKIRRELGGIPIAIVANDGTLEPERILFDASKSLDPKDNKGPYFEISVENDVNILAPTEFLARKVVGIEGLSFRNCDLYGY
uniref:Ras family GTPase n=1 Tax=Pithovirus LCPAC304 TaxID=2506594 RepID=A0A481ZAB1_9VIRU|nr:MAG: Ras family GTPase [Pithovirus LCPAC304]